MNRRLRNRHRVTATVLAAIVPAVFVAGLAVRPDLPTNATLPGAGIADAATEALTVIDGAQFGIGRIMSGESLTAVVLAPEPGGGGLGKPDVLVYWSPDNPSGQSAPADGLYLLGVMAPQQKRVFDLPPAAASRPGYLSFYSLAAKEMLWVEPNGALSLGRVP